MEEPNKVDINAIDQKDPQEKSVHLSDNQSSPKNTSEEGKEEELVVVPRRTSRTKHGKSLMIIIVFCSQKQQ